MRRYLRPRSSVSRCPTRLGSWQARLSWPIAGPVGREPAPLPDFYIGAHAAVAGYRLLTRDARRYRTYFPRLDLLAPS